MGMGADARGEPTSGARIDGELKGRRPEHQPRRSWRRPARSPGWTVANRVAAQARQPLRGRWSHEPQRCRAAVAPRLFDKLWDARLVATPSAGMRQRCCTHRPACGARVTSPRSSSPNWRRAACPVRRPGAPSARWTATPTLPAGASGRLPYATADAGRRSPPARERRALGGVRLFRLRQRPARHRCVIGPGCAPGMTIVCDSHRHPWRVRRAFAFGIGTSEVGHVLATHACCSASRGPWRFFVDGGVAAGVTARTWSCT